LISSIKSSRLRELLAVSLLLDGCAGTPLELPAGSAPTELAGVPFFPQTDYQCGPAALATVLAHAGAPVDADGLVAEVYIEGLRGSLQPELLGATRRNGLIPYVLAPDAAALFAELRAGRPVLVLQNLGFDRAPVWHYAVVIGFDRDADRVILRSGTEQRLLTRGARFQRTWQRGANWAFVALAPGELPASATPALYVRALAGAEPLLDREQNAAAFAAAVARWPNDELVLFAAAGRHLSEGDLPSATMLYRRLLSAAPEHAAARNNLANVLAERGCYAEALTESRAALAAVEPGSQLYAAITDTAATIERAAAAAPSAACP
jgi:tetratricopeptide (TPR) repeat protein